MKQEKKKFEKEVIDHLSKLMLTKKYGTLDKFHKTIKEAAKLITKKYFKTLKSVSLKENNHKPSTSVKSNAAGSQNKKSKPVAIQTKKASKGHKNPTRKISLQPPGLSKEQKTTS